jgi:dipeptidyl aminopeptidase/acylaminoacyl peptidase
VFSAAFSPDGTRIVTASYNTTRIWDAASGKPIGEPLIGPGGFMSASFSPDGKRIVTASQDYTARVWDAESGQPISAPIEGHASAVVSAAFSPDSNRIVTASWDKTALIWVFPDIKGLVSAAKVVIPRCLTPAQRKTFFLPPEPPAWCIEMEKWPYDTAEWKQWLADKRANKNPPLPAAPQ